VKAFVALSGALNLCTVAEGVETQQQSDILLQLGCRLAQGWRFGRPMDEAAFLAVAGAAPQPLHAVR
jgi:EAL domain-containing protein (putative c-di-GMP-specific phosphodiesterase class I)